jgi:hypothetical protein
VTLLSGSLTGGVCHADHSVQAFDFSHCFR